MGMTDQRQNAWVCAQAAGADVLHVGCGDGEATIMLGRKHKSVVGTEPRADDLADARHRLVEEDEEVQGRVRFVTCRPTKLPFERNAFDGSC